MNVCYDVNGLDKVTGPDVVTCFAFCEHSKMKEYLKIVAALHKNIRWEIWRFWDGMFSQWAAETPAMLHKVYLLLKLYQTAVYGKKLFC